MNTAPKISKIYIHKPFADFYGPENGATAFAAVLKPGKIVLLP